MDNEELYVAIDQGGHASRVLVFDESGEVVARGLSEVGETRPRPGWVEQEAEEIVASIRAALDQALDSLDIAGKDLRAGLATQRSSIVCWNRATGEALSPVISWQDRRAGGWLAGLSLDAEWVHERTGLYPTAHYGASKLRWCLDHLPGLAAARDRGEACCGPLASFLIFRLLDERPFVVDPANAARTLLWNRHTFDWDDELLTRFGVARDVLPSCRSTRHAFGALRAKDAKLPLAMVNGDQSAAVFGAGSPEEGAAYVNLGTGAFVQRVARHDPGSPPGLLPSVVLRDGETVVYVVEGTVNGAGSALRRVADECGLAGYEADLHEWLGEVENPPLFLNGVSGLGSPWWVPDFKSRFVGEGNPHEKMVATAESVVFLLRVNLSRLASHAPGLDRVVVTGGLSGYDGICGRLADLTGLPVERSAEFEATSRGTAFLVAGCPSSWSAPGVSARFEPKRNPRLTERFARWRDELDSALAVQGS
jgi:glycerol kinase